MPDLTTVTDFQPWAIDYNISHGNAVTRTQQRGYKKQASYSHREVMLVDATRRLQGAELPFFESFVRTECDEGTLAFTDKYKDGGGVQSGSMRIVNGAYTVAPAGSNFVWDVSCQLEVFR